MAFELSDTSKRRILIATAAAGFGVSLFFAYRVLYTAGVSEYAKEFTAGCIGAIITVLATAALLRTQAESEITRDQLSGIFREKLEMYREFITFLNKIARDRVITPGEIQEAIDWGSRLALVCHPGVIRRLYEFCFQSLAFGAEAYSDLSDGQKEYWREWMLEQYDDMQEEFSCDETCEVLYTTRATIIAALRDDLANKKIMDFDENMNLLEKLDELLYLHSVSRIRFNDDGSIEAEIIVPERPRRRRKSASEERPVAVETD